MLRILLLFTLTFGNLSALAFTELSGDYGLDRTKYGTERQNKIITEHIRTSVAFYLFRYTAFELNYSQSETVTTEKKIIFIDSTYDITGSRNRVFVYSYGIGIRQAFAAKRARFRPSLSLGYAQRFVRDTTVITLRNKTSGNVFNISNPISTQHYDSVFGSLALNFRLTKYFALRGSVNTIFKAFKFNQAQDNVKYMVGFSWVF